MNVLAKDLFHRPGIFLILMLIFLSHSVSTVESCQCNCDDEQAVFDAAATAHQQAMAQLEEAMDECCKKLDAFRYWTQKNKDAQNSYHDAEEYERIAELVSVHPNLGNRGKL